jgi:hypothetical protein
VERGPISASTSLDQQGHTFEQRPVLADLQLLIRRESKASHPTRWWAAKGAPGAGARGCRWRRRGRRWRAGVRPSTRRRGWARGARSSGTALGGIQSVGSHPPATRRARGSVPRASVLTLAVLLALRRPRQRDARRLPGCCAPDDCMLTHYASLLVHAPAS